MKKPVVYAFIDGQNLNLGVKNDVYNKEGKKLFSGKKLNYKKLKHYLVQKYGVTEAYIFIGMIPTNNQLYVKLQKAGFTLIFKTIATYTDSEGNMVTKGNVDTDIVLYAAARLISEYDKAIFISGDGDFLSLYQYIDELGKLGNILVPNRYRYSKLLNNVRSKLGFISDIKEIFDTTTNQKTRSVGRNKSLGLPGYSDNSSVSNNKKHVNSKGRKSI
jgi:uncharacterized LabA/DUF88 family protein